MVMMHKKIMIGIFILLLISPVMGWLVKSDARIDENRRAIVMPNISLNGVVSPEFYTAVEQYFNDPAVETYLIDRASGSSLFLLVDVQQKTHRVVDVENAEIQSITYSPSP